jgi:hypothetical protein
MSLMDWLDWMRLVQDAAPLLPQASLLPMLRQAGWALVLAALVSAASHLFAARRIRDGGRLLALTLALWACIPGPWGLSYWLGLAFQTPSLMAMALSLHYFWQGLAHRKWPQLMQEPVLSASRQHGPWQHRYAVLGIVLGWLLVVDTFGYLPVSLYAWGFSPLAYALFLLLAMGPWVMGTRLSQTAPAPTLFFILVWFGLTRWPTGNLWDAVLDPWLFIGLQIYLVARYRAHRSA